jgi:adenine/guanine phosphoribosyltransferase-like PRPP-binding protein
VAYEPVGTALAKRIERMMDIKDGPGCGCRTLAGNMDVWGISGCEQRREEITDHLVKNRDILIASLKGWTGFAAGIAIAFAPDSLLKAGADWLLSQAMNDVKGIVKPVRDRRTANSSARGGMRGAFMPGNGPVRFVRSSQFQTDILNLIAKIPADVTAIAGVARSGLSAATMLSMYLHLPMITIRQTMNDVVATGNGWRLGGSQHVNPKTEKILVVDDTVMTGNSLKAIKPLIDREFGNAIYAAVYVNPKAARKPDIWSVDLPWPHVLEWNVFNSILSPASAMDFDGILCHDCPPGSDDDGPRYLDFIRNAKPLYMPRRCPVPLIVTARIERYREETENWLRRHGIRWHKLVMHPAKTLAERRRDNVAAYKSRHYMAWAKSFKPSPGPHIFFESEDHQAKEIAKSSRLLTICPHTAGCYE